MPVGDNSAYTDKERRQAEHIADTYRQRGASEDRAISIGWATVNKLQGGGKKTGSGRGVETGKSPAIKARKKGGASRKRAGRATPEKKASRKIGKTRMH